MTEQEIKILHRLIRWADFCAGEGLFEPGGDDPADIMMDWFNLEDGCPSVWPDDVRKNWDV